MGKAAAEQSALALVLDLAPALVLAAPVVPALALGPAPAWVLAARVLAVQGCPPGLALAGPDLAAPDCRPVLAPAGWRPARDLVESGRVELGPVESGPAVPEDRGPVRARNLTTRRPCPRIPSLA